MGREEERANGERGRQSQRLERKSQWGERKGEPMRRGEGRTEPMGGEEERALS